MLSTLSYTLDQTGSARIQAMGGSGMLVNDAVDGIFQNPATLARKRATRADFLYSIQNKFGVESYWSHSLAVQLPDLPLGPYKLHSGLSIGFEKVDQFYNDGIPLARSFHIGLSAAGPATRYITYGLDLNFSGDIAYNEREESAMDSIFQVRAGMIAAFGIFRTGLTLTTPEDFANEYIWEHIRLGAGVKFDKAGFQLNSSLRLLDSKYHEGIQVDYDAGMEKIFADHFAFRLGIYRKKVSLGFGIEYKRLCLDYSFMTLMGGYHIAGIKYGF